ncbi:hypothetical protein MASR1M101_33760 [Gemmatimonas sp.]
MRRKHRQNPHPSLLFIGSPRPIGYGAAHYGFQRVSDHQFASVAPHRRPHPAIFLRLCGSLFSPDSDDGHFDPSEPSPQG